jgi:uncharacterized protein YbaP (TraB family)
MRLRVSVTALLFLCFVPSAPAVEPKSASTATQRFEQGLLWRIEKSGVAPSYAFGTIHIDDPRVLELPPAVTRALGQSKNFTMEMLTDEAAHRKFTRASRLGSGEDLPAVLGPALYREVAEKMEERGFPDAATRRLKPWSVMLTLLLPRERPVVILDYALYQIAQEQKKPVFALETVEEQIETFDGMPNDVQIGLLESVVRHEDEIPEMTKALIRAYLDRDLKRMWEINARFTGLDPGTESLNDVFLERVLFSRNQRMTQTIVPRLNAGGAFVAVGALHLYGERGILALLKQQGYRVRRVY